MSDELRRCLRDPIPEIFVVARALSDAVDCLQSGDRSRAVVLLSEANDPRVRGWCTSLWGAKSPYVRVRSIGTVPTRVDGTGREAHRMPNKTLRARLIARDGYFCRFCGIPVIRAEIRRRLVSAFPEVPLWGKRNIDQHAALQTMWLQYDHLVPWSRGGASTEDNMVIACAPCNFARMQYTVSEVGLRNPLDLPVQGAIEQWDGLERLLIRTTVSLA